MDAENEVRYIVDSTLRQAKERNSQYSLRALAKKAGVSPTVISDLIRGRRRITRSMASKVLTALNVEENKINELVNLLGISKSKTLNEDLKQSKARYTEVDQDTANIICTWQFSSILMLIETNGFCEDPEWISQRLGLTIERIEEIIEFIIDKKYVTRNSVGRLVLNDNYEAVQCTPFERGIGLLDSATELLKIAKNEIFEDRKNHTNNIGHEKNENHKKRYMANMVMSIDTKRLPTAYKMLDVAMNDIANYLDAGPESDEVYCFMPTLFPLSKPIEKENSKK